MKRERRFVTAIVAAMVVSGSIFYACKKDAEETEFINVKNLKSSNYSQPTQDITISTYITMGTIDYLVTGQAVVGSYDGRIYECTATWTKFAGTNDEIDVVFTATLKTEHHNIMIPIDPSVMSNYTITVSNGLTETSTEIITLWSSIVAFCEANVTLMSYPFVLPADMAPYQYAIYLEDVEYLFDYIDAVFENIEDGEESGCFIFSYKTANALIQYGYITPENPYYKPNPYDTTNNGGGGMCFEYVIVNSKGFKNAKDAAQWGADQVEGHEGYVATMNYNKKKKEYFVIIQKWEDDD